jgi:hypothetical protein
LLLDASAFPVGWQAGAAGKIRGPIVGQAHEYDRVFRGFTGPSRSRIGNTTGARQDVYRYGGQHTAKTKFEEKRKQLFKSDAFTRAWETPDGLDYQSSVADRFHLGCTHLTTRQVCRALGQYEEYVVMILVDVYPDSDVTYPDFERILAALEERIMFHLQSQ